MNNIRTIKYLTQDELKRLLKAVDSQKDKAIYTKRDKAIIIVAYNHGLRASEIGMIKLNDVDLDSQRIRINRLKNSLGGEYPIQPDEIKAIKAWLRQRKDGNPYLFTSQRNIPISRREIAYIFNKYAGIAGIPPDKRHFHVLKHSIATHLLDAGADISFIKVWLGHKRISSTEVYAMIKDTTRDEKAITFFSSHYIVKS